MVCEKCLDKFSRQYQRELDKLTPDQRKGSQGRQLSVKYLKLMQGGCKHESAIVWANDPHVPA